VLGADSLLQEYCFGFDVHTRNSPLIQRKWPLLLLSKKDLALFGDKVLPETRKGSKTEMKLNAEHPENPVTGEKTGKLSSRKSTAVHTDVTSL